MTAATPDVSEIDAAIAKGEWWLRLLEELAEAGVALAGELAPDLRAGRIDAATAADSYERVSAAVRLAIAQSVRLEQALRGLTALRACSAEEIAAAKAAALAEAREKHAARERARAQARARREARTEEVRELVLQVIDREAADAEDHEALSLALEARLSFEPAWTDLDSLPLRDTVERICADLRIAPDWSRWEAGRWRPRRTPAPGEAPDPGLECPQPALATPFDAVIPSASLVRLE